MSMKHFAAALVLGVVNIAQAECYLRSATTSTSGEKIQRISDVRQWVVPFTNDVESGKQCSVSFKAQIKGRWYAGLGKHSWVDEQTTDSIGCRIALELGKQTLVRENSQEALQTQQTLVCTDEPETQIRPVAEGDIIKESAVRPHPVKTAPFAYNGTVCKWFIEMDITPGGFYQWQGLICELRPGEWRVVNKF